MNKKQVIRGGLLFIVMLLCLYIVNAEVYFASDFDTNTSNCSGIYGVTTFDTGGSNSYSCTAEDSFLKFRITGQYFNIPYNTPISNPNNKNFTISFDIKFPSSLGSIDSASSIYDRSGYGVNRGTIQYMRRHSALNSGNTFFTYSSDSTTVYAQYDSDIHHIDYVRNTTDQKVYIYWDGVYQYNINSYYPPAFPTDIPTYLSFITTPDTINNYFWLDALIVQDGIHINETIEIQTCNDGIDNDGDGFIDLYDIDCDNDLGNDETTYNAKTGVFWKQDFTTPQSGCTGLYGFTFDSTNTTGSTATRTCSVSSGSLNLNLLNYHAFIPFDTSISNTDRINENYTITLKIKPLTTGIDQTYFSFSSDDEFKDTLQYFYYNSTNGNNLFFKNTDTGIDIDDYLNEWIILDIVHIENFDSVYFFVDGDYKDSLSINNLGNTLDIEDLRISNGQIGNTLSTATNLQIDYIKFSWGNTAGDDVVSECDDGIDNDGDNWTDANDPDCLTKNVEDTIDDYPTPTPRNITIFYDGFSNGDFVSDGWIETTTNDCIEHTYLGNTVVRSDGSGDCIVTQDLYVGDHNLQLYSFDFVPEGSTTDNYIRWYDSAVDYISIDFDQDPDRIRIRGYGQCGGGTIYGWSAFTWTDGVSQNLKMLVNRSSGVAEFYFNDILFTTITDSNCFDYDETISLQLDMDVNDMEVDSVNITDIGRFYECEDGIDNDNDGYIDYPNDIDCETPYSEEIIVQKWACNDGIDNDNDGYIDYPYDLGCVSSFDNDELPKQGTACQEETECSESQWCVMNYEFDCSDTILNHYWFSDPYWYGTLLVAEEYNSRNVLPLHNFLGYSILLDNGSLEQTDEFTIYKQYSDNTKEYDNIDQSFDFFFEHDQYTDGQESNEEIELKFYNSDYNINNLMFKLRLRPIALTDSRVVVNVYAVNEFGNETLLGVMSTNDYVDSGRIKLHVVSDNDKKNYYVYWEDLNGISDESERQNFHIFTYDYADRLEITVEGDPIYFSQSFRSEVNMYLNSVKVSGIQDDTTTICSSWERPYYLVEDFNGYMTDCGWSLNINDIYNNGNLYVSEDTTIFEAYKYVDLLNSQNSRYFNTELTFYAYSFVDEIGYTLVELFDDDNIPVFAYYISKKNQSHAEIGYYTDGDFIELNSFEFLSTQRINAIYDFTTDSFDLYLTGQSSAKSLIGDDLKGVNPDYNLNNANKIKIFSYRGTYAIDSLKIFTSDKNGLLVAGVEDEITIVTDPYPEWAGDYMCGYFVSESQPKVHCSEDIDCETGICGINNECALFDYTYCDKNGKVRGNGCIASAVTECTLTKSKNVIFDNFLLFLVFLIILIVIVYLVMMMKQ